MRFCILLVGLLLTDAMAFDGRYRAEMWQGAKSAGTRVNFTVASQLRAVGLGR
jgi:hypothetical protein